MRSNIMSNEYTKRAAEMLLNGATLLSEPCPYCKGVRVMKNVNSLCCLLYTSDAADEG